MPDSEKGYIYVLPEKMGMQERMPSSLNMPVSVMSPLLEFSHQFEYLNPFRVLPAALPYISTHTTQIDCSTIAGDDTTLIIPREPATHEDVKEALEEYATYFRVKEVNCERMASASIHSVTAQIAICVNKLQ